MAEIHLTEAEAPPRESLLFGVAAILPLLAFAAGAWLLPFAWLPLVVALGVVWGAAILIFLAGVRRGLSFRTPGGTRPSQLATMLWLFLAGLLALASPWPAPALLLLILGYGSLALLDPMAARRGEAPPFLGRLRPVQMAVGLLCLLALLLRVMLVA
ncbi:DUF3429 domain-containing protein [Paracraurococcus lichenis]|uniref:DUF3429 domain-containing protein n=1 Tax=Paracraurococcus lichenis TaxID=3064888 RepID=A0ABT9E6M8_9PROT|nr:DUF3429 domain-containing protein [Paracraurococcus sp. LOR1-02]MDO9711842.1 DUF3429 domain-containing protein [Paracraurococcus sp. LOR1-02]